MKTATPKPTAELVRELFDYRAETGELVWKVLRPGTRCGEVAGTKATLGYNAIGINRKIYQARRIIWLWHTGKFPENEIRHINGIKDDDRIEFLYEIKKSLARPVIAKSGMIGVTQYFNKWRARINTATGLTLHIGSFETADEAQDAFRKKHVEIHGIDSPYFDQYHTPRPALVKYASEVLAKINA